jgi:hypothetical protein
MTSRPFKRGRSETRGQLRRIVDRLRDDADPDMRWIAQRFAAVLEADDEQGGKRYTAVLDAFGLFGRLDTQQERIRAAVAGIGSAPARRAAFRQAFPRLCNLGDRAVDRRIRAALS